MILRKIMYITALAVTLTLSGCKDDEETVIVNPTARGTVTDDMGNSYEWVRIGDMDWTTSNALNGPSCAYATYEGNWGPENVFYSDAADYMKNEYIPQYGNLMNLEDAIASAPDGWRLPSDEDWKTLERSLGMKDADNLGWRGNGVSTMLMDKDSATELGLLLGGGCLRRQSYGALVLEFQFFKERGYYWSSTLIDDPEKESMAYFRKVMFGQAGVERQGGSPEYLLSVRWCRNAVND